MPDKKHPLQPGHMTRRTFGVSTLALGAALPLRPLHAQDAAPTDPSEVWQYIDGLAGEERRDVLTREAAREGGAVIYGALGIDRAKFIIDEFNKVHPDIRIDFVRLKQGEIPTRLQAETQTDNAQADMVISTVTYANVIKDYLAPFRHESWDRWDERFLFGSMEEGWTSTVYELLPTTIAWRTDRGISDEEAPKTIQDVMDTKWKGRTGCTTQLEEFIDAMVEKYGEEEGMAGVTQLADLDNNMVASNAALAELLGSGAVDVTWNFVAHRAHFLDRKGAPIKWTYMRPQFAQGVGISALKDAPHPYSAALFLDHLLSASAMETLDQLEPGRIFGNLDGTYRLSLADFPDLQVYRPLPVQDFSRLNRLVENTFIRRR